jgi:DsbC/DsbD-like thiol-disulfide interchange protein
MAHVSGMIQVLRTIFLAALSVLVPVTGARAQEDMVEVSIVNGWQMADGSHVAALKFVLADGWKTYWRAPGEAGIPPQFVWRGSRNLARAEIEWPTPKQTMTNGMRTIGYEHVLVLPLRLTPERVGQPITLSVDMEIGVCSDICVPVSLTVTQPLDGGQRRPDPQIAAALAARPYTQAEAGVGRVACKVSPIEGGGVHLVAEVDVAAMGAQEMVVVETGNPALWVTQAESVRQGNRLRAEAEIFHAEGRGFMLDRGGLRLTILSTGDAVDIRGCPAG